MLLTSTRAVPNAPIDRLSDYDVILIMTDIQPWVTDRAWLGDFGEVLVVYWDPVYHDPEFDCARSGNVTQYTSGLKIDFTLWPVTMLQKIIDQPILPPELDAGYRILLDKDQLATKLRPPTGSAYIPQRPSLAVYQTLINDFLSDAPYVAKCLWRDELLPAKWCLDSDMKQTYLRQLLEWRMAIDHNWAVPTGALGKGLKKRLPPAIWAQVEESFADGQIANNWQSLTRTMALFRQLAVEVGHHLGYDYPHDLHSRVQAYVEQIKHLHRP
jgi:aminoglycoside 6-adenylyltransferase